MQQSPQFRQQFEEYVSNQTVVAAAACALGGIIVVTLSLIGGLGVDFLYRSGYSWGSFFLYMLIIPLGLALWRGISFAEYVASGLIAFDLLLDIILSYSRHRDWPAWMFVFKFVLFLAVLQLVMPIEEEPDQPQPPTHAPPGSFPTHQPPQQQQPSVGPQPRRRPGPPGPRR